MIIHWQQLVLYYGAEINAHRPFLETAGRKTYALLLCRSADDGVRRVLSYEGDHAEQRLLEREVWTTQIPNALKHQDPLNPHPLIVTLALNRTPYETCADQLVRSLNRLAYQFAWRIQHHSRFILACRGYYQGRSGVTTVGWLSRLHDAGWEGCVLQFGAGLPYERQQGLLACLQRLPDQRRPLILRLQS